MNNLIKEYLVEVSCEHINDFQKRIIESGGIIKDKLELLPFFLVEHKNIETLKQLNFVKSIQVNTYGKLAMHSPIDVRPTLNFKPLKQWLHYDNIKVAIIDSGIDFIKKINIIDRINFTEKHTNVYKHGSIVGAIINEITPSIQLIDIKVTNSSSVELWLVMKALEVAVQKGANIVNLSLGFSVEKCNGSCQICRMVELLRKQFNILVVTAAGNDGPAKGTIKCPGNSRFAFTVGSINLNRNIACFSSRGRYGQMKPDIVTSGFVYVRDPKLKISPQSLHQGTSFSTPIITGLAAGMYEKYDDWEQIKQLIMNSTIQIDTEYCNQGKGVLCIEFLERVLQNDAIASGN